MGFVDVKRMRDRFWTLSVGGTEFPQFFMDMLQSIEVDESIFERDTCTITFADLINNKPVDVLTSEMYDSIIDIKTEKGNYFFTKGLEIEVAFGYNPDQDAFRGTFVINTITTSYPESGNPTVTLKCLDKSVKLSWHRLQQSWKASKVSDIVVPIAEAYGLGYFIDDVIFGEDLMYPCGKMDDYTFLKYIASIWGLDFDVQDGTILMIDADSAFTSKRTNSSKATYGERHSLYYRSGDNSLLSATFQEKSRGKKSTSRAARKQAWLNHVLTSTGKVTELPDKGESSVHHIKRLEDEANAAKAALQETVLSGAVPTTKEQVSFKAIMDNQGVWKAAYTTIGLPTKEEVVDKHVKDSPTASGARRAAKKNSHTFKATLPCLYFDMALTKRTLVTVYGLGHRNNGKYRIGGRRLSMDVNTPPSLVLKVDRYRKPKAKGKTGGKGNPNLDGKGKNASDTGTTRAQLFSIGVNGKLIEAQDSTGLGADRGNQPLQESEALSNYFNMNKLYDIVGAPVKDPLDTPENRAKAAAYDNATLDTRLSDDPELLERLEKEMLMDASSKSKAAVESAKKQWDLLTPEEQALYKEYTTAERLADSVQIAAGVFIGVASWGAGPIAGTAGAGLGGAAVIDSTSRMQTRQEKEDTARRLDAFNIKINAALRQSSFTDRVN